MSQSDKPAGPRTYRLKLYVVGETANSLRALENLKRICDEELADRYELEVIDVLVSPQLADEDKIVAIPTLIKELPQPLRKVVGDLSDRDQVLLGLDLVATGGEQ